MTTTTLRALNGFDETPAALADSTLVMIDYQNTYTAGVMELDGWQAALDSAADLLHRARAAGAHVIHVQHDAGEGTPYDITADSGALHPRVAPVDGESVIVKQAPNAFVGTDLAEQIEAADRKGLILAGFMTHMCVLFTSEGAFLRGHHPTVVASACATRPLRTVPARQLHDSALATITDLYGVVADTPADLG